MRNNYISCVAEHETTVQRLRVFVHFQLSTTWLNSTVGVEQKYWHERGHCSSDNDVLQTLIIL